MGASYLFSFSSPTRITSVLMLRHDLTPLQFPNTFILFSSFCSLMYIDDYPGVIQNLTVSSVSSDSVTLSWEVN